MAEIQARSQPPIFFRQVEDGDRRCQSDLGIMELQLLSCFMEGPVVIPVIMEILTDFLGSFQNPGMTLTRRNQMLLDWDI